MKNNVILSQNIEHQPVKNTQNTEGTLFSVKGEGSDACPADASQEVQNNPGNDQHEQGDGKGPFQPFAQRDTGDCQRTGSSAQGGGYQVGEAVAELECGNSQVAGHTQAFCHRLDTVRRNV